MATGFNHAVAILDDSLNGIRPDLDVLRKTELNWSGIVHIVSRELLGILT